MINHGKQGFTFIEIIIALAVISILIGIASLSIHSVFDNSIEANVYELQADLLDARNRTMMEYAYAYGVCFYDMTQEQYGYHVMALDRATGDLHPIKEKRFPKHFILEKEINETWTVVETLSPDRIKEELTFRFSSELGEGLENDFDNMTIDTFNSALGTNAVGRIRFRSQNTSKTMQVTVVRLTGRVNVNEI